MPAINREKTIKVSFIIDKTKKYVGRLVDKKDVGGHTEYIKGGL